MLHHLGWTLCSLTKVPAGTDSVSSHIKAAFVVWDETKCELFCMLSSLRPFLLTKTYKWRQKLWPPLLIFISPWWLCHLCRSCRAAPSLSGASLEAAPLRSARSTWATSEPGRWPAAPCRASLTPRTPPMRWPASSSPFVCVFVCVCLHKDDHCAAENSFSARHVVLWGWPARLCVFCFYKQEKIGFGVIFFLFVFSTERS